MTKFLAVITTLLLVVSAILFAVAAMAGETNSQRQDRLTLQQQQADQLHQDLSDIGDALKQLLKLERNQAAEEEAIRKGQNFREQLEWLEQEDGEESY